LLASPLAARRARPSSSRRMGPSPTARSLAVLRTSVWSSRRGSATQGRILRHRVGERAGRDGWRDGRAHCYICGFDRHGDADGCGHLITTPTAHGLVIGDTVSFGTVTSKTGITAGDVYFVLTVPSSITFTVSGSLGGAKRTLTTDGSTTAAYRRERAFLRQTTAVLGTATAVASTDRLTFPAPHGLDASQAIAFSSITGAAGLVASMYVKTVIDSRTITVSTTAGGTLVDITSDGTATAAVTGVLNPALQGTATRPVLANSNYPGSSRSPWTPRSSCSRRDRTSAPTCAWRPNGSRKRPPRPPAAPSSTSRRDWNAPRAESPSTYPRPGPGRQYSRDWSPRLTPHHRPRPADHRRNAARPRSQWTTGMRRPEPTPALDNPPSGDHDSTDLLDLIGGSRLRDGLAFVCTRQLAAPGGSRACRTGRICKRNAGASAAETLAERCWVST
jgi:hypothetical protein